MDSKRRRVTIHSDTRGFQRLVGAVVQVAVRDAQNGCPKARQWLRDMGVAVDLEGIDRRLLCRGQGNRAVVDLDREAQAQRLENVLPLWQ